MINPSKVHYVGVRTKQELYRCHGVIIREYDLYDKLFKYAFDEPLQIWVKWSITLDQYIITKVRRAPRKRGKNA